MKALSLVLALACASAAAQQKSRQERPNYHGNYPELHEWMQDAGDAAKQVGALEKKTGEKAVDSGENLGSIYESMIGFWRQMDAPDAVKLSTEGKAAAVEFTAAALAGHADKAASAWAAVSATCHSCHEKHREKLTDGKYRIK